ncbi:hypothetical protein KKB18_13250 [bacterium]|nr:hypothetical protein [bacterium]
MTLEINRAPLLGRRDAFYDKAREVLETKDLDLIFSPLDKDKINIIFLLRQTIFNAKFAFAYLEKKPENYKNFLEHLDILYDESKVGYFALKHCHLIGREEGFIKKYYGKSEDKINEYIESYRKRSLASMEYLNLHVQIADKKYKLLKKKEQNLLTPDEKERYLKAYSSVKESDYYRSRIPTGFIDYS